MDKNKSKKKASKKRYLTMLEFYGFADEQAIKDIMHEQGVNEKEARRLYNSKRKRKKNPSGSRRQSKSNEQYQKSLAEWNESKQNCPHCHATMFSSSLEEHYLTCSGRHKNVLPEKPEVSKDFIHSSRRIPHSNTTQSLKKKCSFCHGYFPACDITRHINTCSMNPNAMIEVAYKPRKAVPAQPPKEPNQKFDNIVSESQKKRRPKEMKQCPHCQANVSKSRLETHIEKRCPQFKKDAASKHKSQTSKREPKPKADGMSGKVSKAKKKWKSASKSKRGTLSLKDMEAHYAELDQKIREIMQDKGVSEKIARQIFFGNGKPSPKRQAKSKSAKSNSKASQNNKKAPPKDKSTVVEERNRRREKWQSSGQTCPDCNATLFGISLNQHTCPEKYKRVAKKQVEEIPVEKKSTTSSEYIHPSRRIPYSNTTQSLKKKCKFCLDYFPAGDITRHINTCSMNPNAMVEVKYRPRKQPPVQSTKEANQKFDKIKSETKKKRQPKEMTQCPHCQAQVAKSRLEAHVEKRCPRIKSDMASNPKAPPNNSRSNNRGGGRKSKSKAEYDNNHMRFSDKADGSKNIGYFRREGGRFGSFPVHDDYSENSWS